MPTEFSPVNKVVNFGKKNFCLSIRTNLCIPFCPNKFLRTFKTFKLLKAAVVVGGGGVGGDGGVGDVTKSVGDVTKSFGELYRDKAHTQAREKPYIEVRTKHTTRTYAHTYLVLVTRTQVYLIGRHHKIYL
jgi:hypothetical protein